MGVHVIKMPDIGEGIAEVELVAWHVKPGDAVVEDQVLADVMTDKATVEIPSPVAGTVLALGGEIGAGDGGRQRADSHRSRRRGQREGGAGRDREGSGARCGDAAAPLRAPAGAAHPHRRRQRPRAGHARPRRRAKPRPRRRAGSAPTRRQAHRLARRAPPRVGSGHRAAVRPRQRHGRPHHARGPRRVRGARVRARQPANAGARYAERNDEEAIPVIGLRRKIAQKMQEAKRRIPHFTYVEEIDVTELEALRAQLNAQVGRRARPPHAAAAAGARDRAGGARVSAGQRALRRRRRHRHPLRRRAHRHRHADRRRPDGAGAAPRRGARPVVHRRGDRAAGRGRARGQGHARGTRAARPSPSPAWARWAASSRRR